MRESVIYQEILQEGEVRGEARGEEKTVQRIVLGMLSEGLPIETIARLTQLSTEKNPTNSIELAPTKPTKFTAIDSFHRSPSTCFSQTF